MKKGGSDQTKSHNAKLRDAEGILKDLVSWFNGEMTPEVLDEPSGVMSEAMALNRIIARAEEFLGND